jgi:hypothetical protein
MKRPNLLRAASAFGPALCFFLASASLASVNPGMPWPATDSLGRELPLAAQAGAPKADRFVGVFYFGWMGDEYSYGPYDVTKILARYPDATSSLTFPHDGPQEWHYAFWGEPLFGYYQGTDPWVIRRHMHMLADAGVDTLVLDATNGEAYLDVYEQLLKVMDEIRKEGGRTPQVFWMLATGMDKVSQQIYERFYKPGRYRDLWFLWEGKPLLIGYKGAVLATKLREAVSPEVWKFFTMRDLAWPGVPPYENRPYEWHWLGVTPQVYGTTDDPKVAESINVSPAQNMHWLTGALELMKTGEGRGRGFHQGRQDDSVEAVQEGKNFQEQWDHALKVDPKFVLITSWNEWIAGLTHSFQRPWTMCDKLNEEFSRDIEPMRGGFGDNFYYQAVANIRRYKGVPEIPKATASKSIDIHGSFDQWSDVGPEYVGHAGNTIPRDHDGFGRAPKTKIPNPDSEFKGNGTTWRGQDGPRYVNQTGRNGLMGMKVARDEEHFYFYVRTEKPITPSTDSNWMMLLIRTGNPTHHDWNGYDYVVNRVSPSKTGAVLEKNNGGWNWLKAADIKFKVAGKEMMMAVPRKVLKLTGTNVQFDFKWADNVKLPDDLTVFYEQGDTAPLGRFRFRYTSH